MSPGIRKIFLSTIALIFVCEIGVGLTCATPNEKLFPPKSVSLEPLDLGNIKLDVGCFVKAKARVWFIEKEYIAYTSWIGLCHRKQELKVWWDGIGLCGHPYEGGIAGLNYLQSTFGKSDKLLHVKPLDESSFIISQIKYELKTPSTVSVGLRRLLNQKSEIQKLFFDDLMLIVKHESLAREAPTSTEYPFLNDIDLGKAKIRETYYANKRDAIKILLENWPLQITKNDQWIFATNLICSGRVIRDITYDFLINSDFSGRSIAEHREKMDLECLKPWLLFQEYNSILAALNSDFISEMMTALISKHNTWRSDHSCSEVTRLLTNSRHLKLEPKKFSYQLVNILIDLKLTQTCRQNLAELICEIHKSANPKSSLFKYKSNVIHCGESAKIKKFQIRS